MVGLKVNAKERQVGSLAHTSRGGTVCLQVKLFKFCRKMSLGDVYLLVVMSGLPYPGNKSCLSLQFIILFLRSWFPMFILDGQFCQLNSRCCLVSLSKVKWIMHGRKLFIALRT